MLKLATLAGASLIVVGGVTAMTTATNITQEEAEQIAAQIQELTENTVAPSDSKWMGDVEITKNWGSYTLAFPEFHIHTWGDFANNYAAIAPYTVELINKDDNLISFTAALPTKIHNVDDGEADGENYSASVFTAEGQFDLERNTFWDLAVDLQDFHGALNTSPDAERFTIGKIALLHDTVQNDDNHVSVQTEFKMNDLVARVGDKLDLGELSFVINADEIDLSLVDFIQEAVATDGRSLDITTIFQTAKKSLDGVAVSFDAKDLRFQEVHYSGEEEAPVNLEEFKFSFGVDGLQGDQASLSLNVDQVMPSMAAVEGAPLEMRLAPQSMAIDLNLKDVPFQTIFAHVEEMAGSDGRVTPAMLMLQSVFLSEELAKAGTRLELAELSTVLPDAALASEGQLHFVTEQEIPVEGEFTFKLSGLDDLLARLNEEQARDDLNYGDSRDIRKMIQAITFAKGAGKFEDGKYVYNFVIDPTGKLLMNGTDIEKLLP